MLASKLQEEIERLEKGRRTNRRMVKEVEKETTMLERRVADLEKEEERRREREAIRSEQIDKRRTMIIKLGSRYNGMDIERWLQSWLSKGKVNFKTAYIKGAAKRMQRLIFEEEFCDVRITYALSKIN